MQQAVCTMRPQDIRAELVRAQVTHSAIARGLDPPVTPRAVGLVIDGLSRSQRIEQAIAAAIGVDVRALWPDWPSSPGRPRSADFNGGAEAENNN